MKTATQIRIANLRSQQTPEKKEQEKTANRKSMANLRSTQTPEKKKQEKTATQIRIANLRFQQTPEKKEQKLLELSIKNATMLFLMELNSYVIFATNYASKETLINWILKSMRMMKNKKSSLN